jgi:hypothetical protein
MDPAVIEQIAKALAAAQGPDFSAYLTPLLLGAGLAVWIVKETKDKRKNGNGNGNGHKPPPHVPESIWHELTPTGIDRLTGALTNVALNSERERDSFAKLEQAVRSLEQANKYEHGAITKSLEQIEANTQKCGKGEK